MENNNYNVKDVILKTKKTSVILMVLSMLPVFITLLVELVEDGLKYFDNSMLLVLIYVVIAFIIGLIAIENSNSVIEFAHNEEIAYKRAKKARNWNILQIILGLRCWVLLIAWMSNL